MLRLINNLLVREIKSCNISKLEVRKHSNPTPNSEEAPQLSTPVGALPCAGLFGHTVISMQTDRRCRAPNQPWSLTIAASVLLRRGTPHASARAHYPAGYHSNKMGNCVLRSECHMEPGKPVLTKHRCPVTDAEDGAPNITRVSSTELKPK